MEANIIAKKLQPRDSIEYFARNPTFLTLKSKRSDIQYVWKFLKLVSAIFLKFIIHLI